MKLNRYILGNTVIAAMGGLLFGFDTAVISGTTEALEKVFSLTEGQLGFTVASALIGTILGALIAGRPADRFGRRPVLFAIAMLYFVSAVGSAFPWDWYSFLFYRFIGGIGVGAASVVSPMYIAEISPAAARGRLVAVTQFNIVLGILLAYLSNYIIAGFHFGATEWRWMFGVEAFPAAAFFFLLFLTPESPRWLVAQRRTDEARAVLKNCCLGDSSSEGMALSEILFSFQGRIRRGLYWGVHLGMGLLWAILMLTVQGLMGIHVIRDPIVAVIAIWALLPIVLWIQVSISVKRWHDLGRSGWMTLMLIVPVVGPLVSLAWLGLVKGDVRPNRFDKSSRSSSKQEHHPQQRADTVEVELSEIRNSLDAEHHSLQEPFFHRAYLKPILLAVAIAAFNQLSGINALIYYTAGIFKMGGAGEQSALLQSVIIGLVNLVYTMVALTVIDHFGRRRLMLVGSIGYILSLSAVAYSFYTGTGGALLLASFVVFIASHAFGQGAVIWVFISEIFPNRVRARGQALGSFTHWIMAAAISWTFPMIAAKSGGHTFAFYALCCVAQLVWVLKVMPETRGVSLEQIQKRLGIR